MHLNSPWKEVPQAVLPPTTLQAAVSETTKTLERAAAPCDALPSISLVMFLLVITPRSGKQAAYYRGMRLESLLLLPPALRNKHLCLPRLPLGRLLGGWIQLHCALPYLVGNRSGQSHYTVLFVRVCSQAFS